MDEVQRKRELGVLLDNLVEELDVPPSKYEDAQNRYRAVGEWLDSEGSSLVPYRPVIYPQGSFALGTAVRPLGDDDYDVDVVCLLQRQPSSLTQKQLKNMVGHRLKEHAGYARMLDPKDGGRRCWTLKYSDDSKFHLDVLPAVPDDYNWLLEIGVPRELAQHAICITDKSTWNVDPDWPKSNPKGYAEWFKNRMRVVLEERRSIVAREKQAKVENVPDYEVRTPLQRIVQLLKRHRDLRYNGDEDKPISVIITTLAGHAYENQNDIVEALLSIVPRMRQAIENRNGVWWVANPVNPQENFADKWAEKPRKAELFFQWLQAIEREHKKLLKPDGFVKAGEYLAESYGRREAAAAMTKYAGLGGTVTAAASVPVGGRIELRENQQVSPFNVTHREAPRWPITPKYEVTVSAKASRDGFRPRVFSDEAIKITKGWSLRYEAETNVPRPYEVFWQVVNTGEEARRADKLRGEIFRGDTAHKEDATYTGTHWIECFIVKDGWCVARSGEFVVNVE